VAVVSKSALSRFLAIGSSASESTEGRESGLCGYNRNFRLHRGAMDTQAQTLIIHNKRVNCHNFFILLCNLYWWNNGFPVMSCFHDMLNRDFSLFGTMVLNSISNLGRLYSRNWEGSCLAGSLGV